MLLGKLQKELKQHCQYQPGQKILIAVSGGPDSLCLLDLLWRLDYPLVVAHLDHSLRPEAKQDAKMVGQLAQKLKLPFVLGQEDVQGYAKAKRLSIEEAARNVRYHFLFQQAELNNAHAVAVGHTADDQVETVLMHLLRGAGLSGLRGMSYWGLPNPWSQTIPIIRPLLAIWRDEITTYIQERELSPILDSSNLDTRFYRNRIRQELIPYLESYNPRLRRLIWRTANLLSEDYAALDKHVRTIWSLCVKEEGTRYVAFDTQVFRTQTISAQRNLIRKAINHLRPGLRDIDFEAVERAIMFLEAPSRSAQTDLIAGLRLILEPDTLWLANWDANLPNPGWPYLSPGKTLSLDIPGEISLPDGWLLQAALESDLQQGWRNDLPGVDPFNAWLDRDKVQSPLGIRTRQPGDRFQPLGMEGHSLKLSDFMINEKLPRSARDSWPLITSQTDIVWVPGFRPAHSVRVQQGTKRTVRLNLQRINNNKTP